VRSFPAIHTPSRSSPGRKRKTNNSITRKGLTAWEQEFQVGFLVHPVALGKCWLHSFPVHCPHKPRNPGQGPNYHSPQTGSYIDPDTHLIYLNHEDGSRMHLQNFDDIAYIHTM
jgi:hypothetical protein